MDIYQILKELNIHYEEITHPAVYTIEEALKVDIPNKINGIECKNLFVKGKKGYYLIVIEASKRTDLKGLAHFMKESKLTFASEEELKNILHLNMGSVTPLGIIYDKENIVTLLLDHELKNQKILVHPNTNTKTISLDYNDLIKMIKETNHTYYTF